MVIDEVGRPAGGGAAEPARRPRYLVAPTAWGIAGLLLVLGLSNRWLGWAKGIEFLHEGDVQSYLAIASAAPGLPAGPVGSDYADRFLVHYAVGLLARVAHVGLPATYLCFLAVVVLAIVVTTSGTLRRLGLSGERHLLCMALLLLNAYAFRYYLIVPGMVADLVFVLGLSVALRGMVVRRPAVLAAGLLLATAGRQTAVLVAPVLAVWWFVDHLREPGSRVRAAVHAVAVLALPLGLYGGVRTVTASFARPYAPRIPQDTILPLLGQLPGTGAVLADHVLRVAAPLVVPVVVLAVAVAARPRRRGLLSGQGWTALAVAGVVVAQPLAVGPQFPGFAYNEPRLSALGLVALVVCMGTVLSPREREQPALPAWSVAAMVGVLAVTSLHHRYAVVGPDGATAFLALQVLGAAALGGVLLLARRRSAAGERVRRAESSSDTGTGSSIAAPPAGSAAR